jgi:hypothetical protein
MYKLVNDISGGFLACIVKTNEDGSITSFGEDPANTDYQAFLRWCEEGNVPTPADEETQ